MSCRRRSAEIEGQSDGLVGGQELPGLDLGVEPVSELVACAVDEPPVAAGHERPERHEGDAGAEEPARP